MSDLHTTDIRTPFERRQDERDARILAAYKALLAEHPEAYSDRLFQVIAAKEDMTRFGVRAALIRLGAYTPTYRK